MPVNAKVVAAGKCQKSEETYTKVGAGTAAFGDGPTVYSSRFCVASISLIAHAQSGAR
jgi:hypothetical protein